MEEPERRVRSHVAGTAAVAAGFFVALVVLLLLGQPATPTPGIPVPSPTPTEPAQQTTLLVQVTLDRVRAASLLTGTGGDPDQAVLVPLPADLLLADGDTYTPLLDANLSLNRRLTAQSVASTLGVRVDGGWRMERKALAGFVDAVGGVTVYLDQTTSYLDTSGQPVLRLPKGASLLRGPQASWYVMGTVPGEDPIAGVQARFQEIFRKAVIQLPSDVETVSAMLTSLGALSDPLEGTTSVAEALVSLHDDFVAKHETVVDLSLRASGAADPVSTRQESQGGPAAAVGAFRVLDYAPGTPPLRRAFPTAPRVAGTDGPPRVLLWNATGVPGVTDVALLELTDAGFVAMSAGVWPSQQEVTRINGSGYLADGQSYVAAAAEALRLTTAEEFGSTGTATPLESATPSPSTPATMPPADQPPWGDVDIVVGSDYQPCPPDRPTCLEQETP